MLNFHPAETEGVINAVASLIGMQEPDPNDDVNRLQYLETDVRKLCALETEWKECATVCLLCFVLCFLCWSLKWLSRLWLHTHVLHLT